MGTISLAMPVLVLAAERGHGPIAPGGARDRVTEKTRDTRAAAARRRELTIVAVVAALLCAAYLACARYGFDLLEEGYFATHARRVQLGGLPYRDFSTPYTPGVFYLYARMLDWFGPDIVPLRWLQVVGRLALGIALYATGRQVLPPFFAALAPALILAVDPAPQLWGLHPGWYSAPAAILLVLAIARYLRDGRGWWLFAAGITGGVGFAFKQNLAAFGLMAALWLLVVAERHLPPLAAPWGAPGSGGRPLGSAGRVLALPRPAVQLAALLLLPLAALLLIRSYLSALLVVLLVLPLAAVSLAGAVHWMLRGEAAGTGGLVGSATLSRAASFYARPLLVLAGFATVTLPWLTLLIRALDGRVALLGGLVGNIDPTGYFSEIFRLRRSDLALAGAALAAPALLSAAGAGAPWRRRCAALGCGVTAGFLAAYAGLLAGGSGPPWGAAAPAWSPYAGTGAGSSGVLFLYLPTLAFWAALARLLRVRARREAPADTGDLLRLWYLAAGSALLLNQYPRMDFAHLLWSGGLLLVVGADVLHAWYRAIVRRLPSTRRRAVAALVVRLSLALLPIVAALPDLRARLDGLPAFLAAQGVGPAAGAGGAFVPLTPPGGGTPVRASADQARPIQEVVELLRRRTLPGEPIFAYPAIPGFYYLADRPNATRFNHLFAGMASPAEQQEIARQLAGVRFVIWDDAGAHHWVQPGDNAPVTEYIRAHFRVEGVIGLYTILAREDGVR